MTPSEPRVLVIGAGPAGLAAAVTAAEAGVRVLVVDEAIGPGGQYLAGDPKDSRFQTPAERDGALLITRLRELCRAGQVDVWWSATVWSLDANLSAMVFQASAGHPREAEGPRSVRVQADAVVLASGARETVAPFPGWTLPGVMTVGAAQLLAKRHGLVPLPAGEHPDGALRRILLAGSGLLLLPAVARLAELGAHIIGVFETARLSVGSLGRVGGLGIISYLGPSLLARRDEAWHYFSVLRKHRIPYYFGRAVLRARASAAGNLEAVDVVRLDGSQAPTPGSTETWPVDLLCVSHGLIPNVELAQLAGADVIYNAALGGWVVNVDERSRVRTSISGLFVAGESAGINGAGAALLSGRVAAMSAAVHLGRLPDAFLQSELTRTGRERRRHVRFGAMENLLFGAPDALYRDIPDDTLLCRCEDVTAGQVRAAISAAVASGGALSLDALKPAIRVGQGLCQGRTCGPILARMLAVSKGTSPEAAGLFRARPPVKPVPLAGIAGLLCPEDPPLQERRRL